MERLGSIDGAGPPADPGETSAPRLTCAVKCAIDVGGAFLLLILAVPLMATVALAVRVSIGSGVIFRQKRVGRDGREFTMLKFRTMRPDRRLSTERRTTSRGDRRLVHKTDDDPRHTPVGRWLRRLSLDELPQLWNVLRRDMSLVGPRPELPMVVAIYQDWQHLRHVVRPGLTGLWQVTARGRGPMHQCTEVDLEYVRRLSIPLDAWIVVRTPGALIRRHGS